MSATAGVRRTRKVWALAVAAVAADIVLVGVLCALVLYIRIADPLDLQWMRAWTQEPLAASAPEEVVLRTLRLAGYGHAAVAYQDGNAVLAVEVPVALTPAEEDLARQTGFATLAVAFPRAKGYVVRTETSATPVVSAFAEGRAVRDAVKADDAGALRIAVSVVALAEGAGQ